MKRKNLRIGNNMKELSFKEEQSYLQAKKRVKEIKGFYVHLGVTVFSSLLIIFINLLLVPKYHFFWFALGGLSISVFIHGIIVFGFPKVGLGSDWERKKMQEMMSIGDHDKKNGEYVVMETAPHKEKQYLKAKQQIAKIKSFYAGVIGYCLVIPFLIFINLTTIPDVHWFWFPAFGWGFAMVFLGMNAFQYHPFLGKGWEENQLKRFIEEDKKYTNSK